MPVNIGPLSRPVDAGHLNKIILIQRKGGSLIVEREVVALDDAGVYAKLQVVGYSDDSEWVLCNSINVLGTVSNKKTE